jgi:hypothetical protein
MENKLFYLLFYFIPFHLRTVFFKCPNARLSLHPVSPVPGNDKNMKLPEQVRYRNVSVSALRCRNTDDVVGTVVYADAHLWSLARGKIVAF